MKNIWKISGWYLFVVGIIHNTVGVILLKDIWVDIWHDGLINSVHSMMDRNAFFWFMFTGILLIFFGLHWQELIKKYQEPLSKYAAWGLTAIIVLGLLFVPVSGFWIVLPLCFFMLYPHYFGAAKSNAFSPKKKYQKEL